MARKKVVDPFLSFEQDLAAARGVKPRVSKGRVREALDVKRKSKKPVVQTGATARSGYDPLSDRLLRAIGRGTGNSQLERNLRAADENLIGLGEAEQSAFNLGRGEGGGWDAANIALALPMAGLVDKPLSLAAKAVGRAGKPLAAKVGNSAAARYLTEARPLLDEAADTVEGAFSVRPAQLGAPKVRGVRPVPPAATERLPLPAPEERLGLPAPGPGLPKHAIKPRGGQWWASQMPGFSRAPLAPEDVAKYYTDNFFVGALGEKEAALQGWLGKALPRYIRNDLATPDDPLRGLAEQGLLHTNMTPDEWSDVAGWTLRHDDIGNYTVPGGARGDLRPEWQNTQVLDKMPWLTKAPVTDKIYGVSSINQVQSLQFDHVIDEMANALNPEASGLPADLAVRPESLARMSFPQAVERVGRINQWRAKQAEQAQLSALNSPAVQMFKEYPDDPRGLRWVELRAPELGDDLPEGYRIEEDPGAYLNSPGYAVFEGRKQLTTEMDPERARAFVRDDYYRPQLQDALRYEGDTMGHCVSGYCDDVLQGRSRIFSLRDARGEPHVTIETGRKQNYVPPEVYDQWKRQADEELRASGIGANDPAYWDELDRRTEAQRTAYLASDLPEDIVQIKGKQNRAPKEDYLPFVQDFVKSGKWGEIGDFANTGLVKLPDGRYITKQQYDEVRSARGLDDAFRAKYAASGLPSNPSMLPRETWDEFAPYFEGFAAGGRVRSLAAKPCSCDKSLAVR